MNVLQKINDHINSRYRFISNSKKKFTSLGITSSIAINAIKEQKKSQEKKIGINKLIKQLNNNHKQTKKVEYKLLQVRGLQLTNNTQNKNTKKQHSEIIKNVRNIQHTNIKKIRSILLKKDNQGARLTNQNLQVFKDIENEQKKSYEQILRDSENSSKLKKYKINMKSMTDFQKNEFYEQLIIKNPLLYRKIIKSYQDQKHKIATLIPNQTMNHVTTPIQKKNSNHQTRSSSFVSTSKNDSNEIYAAITFKQFNLVINLSNQIVVKTQFDQIYKAYICKGNNGVLVKMILKFRPWWQLGNTAELNTCSLVWTEWKKPKIFETLKACQPKKTKEWKQIDNESSLDTNIDKNIKINNLKKIIYLDRYDRLKSAISNHPLLYFNPIKKRMHAKNNQFYENYTIDKSNYKVIQHTGMNKIVNHLQGGLHLHSKKLLFYNMRQYFEKNNQNVFDYLPVTYVVKKLDDKQFLNFVNHFNQIEQKNKVNFDIIQKKDNNNKKKQFNIWICKPGQNSNRGNGISLSDNISQIKTFIRSREKIGRTLLIQKYIDYPFLYHKRKFDIRCYLLITCINGYTKAYWYDEGYIRTSSKQYTLKNIDNRMIHLTNDAVQKKSEEYGKFEGSNKINFQDFQKYLDGLEKKYDFFETFKKIKQIARHMVKSVANKIVGTKKEFTFQLFGLDFMLDENFKPYLIEANSNPCLQVSGLVLGKIIPNLIDNVLRIVIDPLFPPPQILNNKYKKYKPIGFESNKFELIYDEIFQKIKYQSDLYINLINEEENEDQEILDEKNQ